MINIIVMPAWSLMHCAHAIADRLPGVTINGNQKQASLNYFMPFSMSKSAGLASRPMGFFAHADNDADIKRCADNTCAQVCMNETMFSTLKAVGASHPVIIRPGTTRQKPITFGVCGKVYRSGRKGEGLVKQMVAAGYTVRAHGQGWPVPVNETGDLDAFYAGIDYLVVTSTNEGGPMPVTEAIAAGVPVIAPNVGWCWEFPVIRYDVGDWNSLNQVLHKLTHAPTWDDWAADHADLFASIIEHS